MTETIDTTGAGSAQQPWWRRPRQLRRQLTTSLIIVTVCSVILVGTLNFIAARQLLDEGTQDQLVGVGESRAQIIESGAARIRGQVSAAAADLAVVNAVEQLTDAFDQLDGEVLSDGQNDELDAAYQTGLVEPLRDEAGISDVTLEDVAPMSDAARFLQFHYTLPTRGTEELGRPLDDAGDGSEYSARHAESHPFLTSLADALGAQDILLVSADTDEIVYSVAKNIDLGTSLASGPFADSALSRTVTEDLRRVRAGDTVVADSEVWIPAQGQPVVFLTAAVRRDADFVGTLVVSFPSSFLNAVTAADGTWEEVGLRGGEAYIVGADMILRTESRAWIEDPEGYLDKVEDPADAQLITFLGSPVGIQVVDTEAVRAALDGEEFAGTTTNYLGQRVFSYATPIEVESVQWIMVTDIPRSDAREPLVDYATRLLIVLVVLVPIAGVIGLWLARRLARPIPPVLEAATAVAEGERDPDLPDHSNDEFGDLARRLGQMANDLAEQEQALTDEFEQKRQLLLTVLPSRVVADDGGLSGTGDAVDEATVISVSSNLSGEGFSTEDERFSELIGEAGHIADSTAEQWGVERVRVGADRALFLAGLGEDDDGADAALAFAIELTNAALVFSTDEHVELTIRIGLATGHVATGVLEHGALTYTAWGEPVRSALAIGALARSQEVLVDESTYERLRGDRSGVERSDEIVALDGRPMALYRASTDVTV